jgi:ATP-dependent Clp protease ATP-binding subunit ClpA
MAGTRIRDLPRAFLLRLRHGDWRGLYSRPSAIDHDRIAPDWHDALRVADSEVRARGNLSLGTQHLLLGLLSLQAGPAADAFRLAGVEPARVRELVDEWLPRGTTKWDPPETLQAGEVARRPRFVGSTRRVVDAQERAFKLSLREGHSRANAAHLLVALLADRRATGHHLLRRARVNTRGLRRAASRTA